MLVCKVIPVMEEIADPSGKLYSHFVSHLQATWRPILQSNSSPCEIREHLQVRNAGIDPFLCQVPETDTSWTNDRHSGGKGCRKVVTCAGKWRRYCKTAEKRMLEIQESARRWHECLTLAVLAGASSPSKMGYKPKDGRCNGVAFGEGLVVGHGKGDDPGGFASGVKERFDRVSHKIPTLR